MWYVAFDIIAYEAGHGENPALGKIPKNDLKLLRNCSSKHGIQYLFAVDLYAKSKKLHLGNMHLIKANNKSAILKYEFSVLPADSEIIHSSLTWLIDYSFNILNLQWLIIRVPHCDIVRQELVKKIGFRIRTKRVFHDEIEYTLKNEFWPYDCTMPKIETVSRSAADEFINHGILPYFENSINSPIYSTIVDNKYEIVICTKKSAESIGLMNPDEAKGLSYKCYSCIEKAKSVFHSLYNPGTENSIHLYAKKIFRIQQFVFKHGKSVSYTDMMPYTCGAKNYLVTISPIFYPNGAVVAIQTTAIEYRLFGYHDYLKYLLPQPKVQTAIDLQFTQREQEVLFLLSLGCTQEEVAQILSVQRATIASIIRNQLCTKLGIAGSNTKLLIQTALQNRYLGQIPKSINLPFVITFEEELTSWMNRLY